MGNRIFSELGKADLQKCKNSDPEEASADFGSEPESNMKYFSVVSPSRRVENMIRVMKLTIGR